MFGTIGGRFLAGKIGYGAGCLLAAVVLVVSGYAYHVVGLVKSTGSGIMINNSPSIGAMNILVMGLESRTNYQGQELDHHLQTVMHIGSVGSQDTNTLILIHIFAGGQKAVGFSIPRDDLVTYPQAYYPGIPRGKIDGAYAWAYNEYLNKHTGSESHADLYLHANQAGQAATIATVQSVTGQHIDHFVEVNLAGFYYLATAFNGIEACIQPYPGNNGLNLTDFDPYSGINHSGFNAYLDGYNKKKGGAQYLHLSPAQSLAFVRSRDTLPGTDLGRTKRQQATIDYVIWKLKHDGAFSDIGTLNALLGTASQYLITDAGFNLFDFATNMRALTGHALAFTTLPFTPQNGVPLAGYGSPQDVNIIDIPHIQQIVKSAFDPQPAGKKTPVAGSGTSTGSGTSKKSASVPAASTVTVDVYNGSTASTAPLAGQTSAALVALGYKAGAVKKASAQSQTVESATQVFYGAGTSANAAKIATELGTTAKSLASLPAGHVEVLIGSTVTAVPAGLTSSAALAQNTIPAQSTMTVESGSPSPAAKSTAGTSSGTGGTVTVAPNAPYGVPCVY
jgi:anionic cell wall polymer biosynthesis LytR-Cps2A-Psr (LCP) family protein